MHETSSSEAAQTNSAQAIPRRVGTPPVQEARAPPRGSGGAVADCRVMDRGALVRETALTVLDATVEWMTRT